MPVIEKIKNAIAPDAVARFETQAVSVAEEISRAEAEAVSARAELAACIESGKLPEAAEVRIEKAEAAIRRLGERRSAVAAALSKARAEADAKAKADALAAAQKALAEADAVAMKAHAAFTDSLVAAGIKMGAWQDAETVATDARSVLMRLGVEIPPAARYLTVAVESARVQNGGGHSSEEVRIYRCATGAAMPKFTS